MGRNHSHVAKQERAEICILSQNVKICQFSSKPNYYYKFLSLARVFHFLLDFSVSYVFFKYT